MQKQLNPVKPTWCFSPAEPSLCLPFLKRLFPHQAPPEGQVDVGGNIYFPHPSTSIPSEKAEGVFLFIYLFFLLVCLLFKVNHHWQNKWISNGLLQLPVLPVLCLFSKHSNISVYEGLCFWCISIIPFCQAKFYQKHLDLAAITIVIIRT